MAKISVAYRKGNAKPASSRAIVLTKHGCAAANNPPIKTRAIHYNRPGARHTKATANVEINIPDRLLISKIYKGASPPVSRLMKISSAPRKIAAFRVKNAAG